MEEGTSYDSCRERDLMLYTWDQPQSMPTFILKLAPKLLRKDDSGHISEDVSLQQTARPVYSAVAVLS